jgi:hypothetical protein
LRPIFRAGNSQTSLGARSGECGGWVMTQQAVCGSVSHRDAETTVPACHFLQGLHVVMTSNTVQAVRTHGAHTVNVIEFRELFDRASWSRNNRIGAIAEGRGVSESAA